MEISTSFCGGNAKNIVIEDNTVRFLPDLRDTEGDWFYWAFEVKGAQGKTLTFDMSPKNLIGYFGAAVSHDLENWEWTNTASNDRKSFTYAFGEKEDDVYFAHHMLYHPSRFYKFAEKRGLAVKILCTDRGGTPIPYLETGDGSRTILLTARHHCCESTGDYEMEGIIDEYLRNPLPDSRLIAIPFIDADGVTAGDQGKNRRPHDHNRDYIDGIYPSVRAVRAIMGQGHTLAAFDLHSPWHLGGRNDKVFIVRNSLERMEDFRLMGRCFESEITPTAMRYRTADDIDPGVEWNTLKPKRISCGVFCAAFPDVDLAFSLETTYFGDPGDPVSQEKIVETGRCFWRGYLRYRREKGETF